MFILIANKRVFTCNVIDELNTESINRNDKMRCITKDNKIIWSKFPYVANAPETTLRLPHTILGKNELAFLSYDTDNGTMALFTPGAEFTIPFDMRVINWDTEWTLIITHGNAINVISLKHEITKESLTIEELLAEIPVLSTYFAGNTEIQIWDLPEPTVKLEFKKPNKIIYTKDRIISKA